MEPEGFDSPRPWWLLRLLEGLDEGLGLCGLDVGGELVALPPADPGPLAAEVAAECVLVDPGGLGELGGVLDGLGGSDSYYPPYIGTYSK